MARIRNMGIRVRRNTRCIAGLVHGNALWSLSGHFTTRQTARTIDRELGKLENDLIGQTPLLSYLRYNIELDRETLRNELGLDLSAKQVTPLSEMDDPGNMPMLKKIGELVGEKKVDGKDFPASFELTA